MSAPAPPRVVGVHSFHTSSENAYEGKLWNSVERESKIEAASAVEGNFGNVVSIHHNATGTDQTPQNLTSSTAVKPFPCPICGKRFSQKGNMKMHQRVHTGEKPFACPTCGKRFSQKGNMQTHTRIHSGVKPFECVECKQAFRQKSKLVAHMKRHQNSGSRIGPLANQRAMAIQLRKLISLTRLNPSLLSKPLKMPLIPGMQPITTTTTNTKLRGTYSASPIRCRPQTQTVARAKRQKISSTNSIPTNNIEVGNPGINQPSTKTTDQPPPNVLVEDQSKS